MHAHIRNVCAQVELVQERALLRGIEERVVVVRADGQAVVVRLSEVTADDTLLVEVAQRQVVVALLRGAADADVVLRDGGIVIEEQVLPVGAEAHDLVAIGIDNVVGVHVERSHAVLHLALVLQDGIVGGTGDVALLPGRLPARGEVVVDLGLAYLTLLRGDQNNAIGSAGTVDGTRCSVLQHFDALDVLGVDALHTVLVGGHAVYNIKRFGVVDGADTADADERLRAGLARGRGHLYASGHTLQGILGTQARLAFQVVGRDLGNRGRDDALLLHAVADDDHVGQRLLVFLQRDGHAAAGRHLLRQEADVAHHQRGTAVDPQRELAIVVGDGAVLRVGFLHNRGSDDGFSVLIDHGSRDGATLGQGRRRKKHGEEGEDNSPQRRNFHFLSHKL